MAAFFLLVAGAFLTAGTLRADALGAVALDAGALEAGAGALGAGVLGILPSAMVWEGGVRAVDLLCRGTLA